MNRFSIWTYTFILMVLSIGVSILCQILYPAKPAIQIAYTDSGKSADQIFINQVKDILEDHPGVESVGSKTITSLQSLILLMISLLVKQPCKESCLMSDCCIQPRTFYTSMA